MWKLQIKKAMTQFNKKTNKNQRDPIKKVTTNRSRNQTLKSVVWKSKNLIPTLTAHAKFRVWVKRKLNKAMISKCKRNNKGILLRPNSMNNITSMIKQARWVNNHSFQPTTWNLSQSQNPFQSNRLWASLWKRWIVKFKKKIRSKNSLSMFWAKPFRIMQNTWFNNHKSSNKPEKQQSSWSRNFWTS